MRRQIIKDAAEDLRELRRVILSSACVSREGHVPSAFSVLDILWVLYHEVLKIDPKSPKDEGRDRFVLSKGHASLGLYAVLAHSGFFPLEELVNFGKYDSILGGHPDCLKVPGVEASTGSLGHGLPMAVGMALGLRIRGISARVFCLIGDGEANEGSVWEAIAIASHHNLGNLCCIVDYNHSTDRALRLGNLGAKFSAFEWSTVEVDGHDHAALARVLNESSNSGPRSVIANTIKGFGCPPMENEPAWHHRSPTVEELTDLIRCLK